MSSTEEKLAQLKKRLGVISDLNYSLAVLGWDQQVNMPPGGADDRGYLIETLSRLVHSRYTDPALGQLMEDLQPYAAGLDPDSDDARLMKVAAREYHKRTKVPEELVAEMAHVTTVAHNVWSDARKESNYAKFRPHLQRIVELRRQYADVFTPYEHVYDPLLDDFEPGLKTTDVKMIFSRLRDGQIQLLREIAEKEPPDDSFLVQPLDPERQLDFGKQVIQHFGFDERYSRQDESEHPFTTSFGLRDVRITTRVFPKHAVSALFSSMHETGHALYDLGFDPKYARTPMADGASFAFHESQSRMWENLVGRSCDFWTYFYPRWQATFPGQFDNVKLDDFYRAINRVERSLIRVESDEATYNLHIMLRLELEIDLMEGTLSVQDLPDAWNDRMEEYLGLRPPDDRAGVLQDVHWSGGSIGYFPTYALGNLISVQLWEKITQDVPDLTQQVRRGEFGALLAWLRENVHRFGAKYEPQELMLRVTGSKIDPEPYLRYLRAKFGEIYRL